MSFQIDFKSVGFFFVFKGNHIFDTPRFVFGCVRNIAIVVFILEVVLILRNSSLKLKTVTDNANLLNYAVSSGNISERIKIQTEN